ncbi:MAG: hypothetical protein GY815_14185 [Gammaproteobacteria bacterium]|nr:hypothetical protein [Gammaproteobacteria bacterium]
MGKGDKNRSVVSFAIVADAHVTEEGNLACEVGCFESGDTYGSKLAATCDNLIARGNAMNPAFVAHVGDIADPVPVAPEFTNSAQAFHSASNIFDMPYYLVPGTVPLRTNSSD